MKNKENIVDQIWIQLDLFPNYGNESNVPRKKQKAIHSPNLKFNKDETS